MPDGTLVYQYADLSRTPISFLATHLPRVVSIDSLFSLVQAIDRILGPPVVQQDEWGGYESYAEDQPVADLLRSLRFVLDQETGPDALDALALHAQREPNAIAGMVLAVDQMMTLTWTGLLKIKRVIE